MHRQLSSKVSYDYLLKYQARLHERYLKRT